MLKRRKMRMLKMQTTIAKTVSRLAMLAVLCCLCAYTSVAHAALINVQKRSSLVVPVRAFSLYDGRLKDTPIHEAVKTVVLIEANTLHQMR